ncbi:MAG: hypothetical protein JWM68_2730, partial [Verrucomicrobiales bacterium]|nr:hypothetical protein [Verrucomicrobiales bacterium]
LYPGGFSVSSTSLVMVGAIHIPRSEGTPYLSSTNGSVHLFDGNLPSEIVESFTVSPNNVVTMAPGTNHLTIFLNATNGTFTGRFVHSVTHVTTAIKGSLTPDIGLGYFIGTNRSGSVVIQPE